MRVFLLLALLIATPVKSADYAVVVSSTTEIDEMEARVLRDVFLRKRKFANRVRLYPVNLSGDTDIRRSFEENILGMGREELNHYWVESHFQGVSPPSTQASYEALTKILIRVDGAITYLPLEMVDQNLHVIYEF